MSSNEELNLQYSTSKWSKRVAPEKIIPLHIEVCTKASDLVKTNVPCQLDISYGNTPREKFDIYGVDLPSDVPVFIFIHGGYWQNLCKEKSSYSAGSLYKHGIKVVVLGYNLCPDVSFSTLVEEVEKGFTQCLKYAKELGSKGVYLCGHSAGAHLVASIFQQSFYTLSDDDKNMIKGAFLISGVFDLLPLVNTYVNNKLKLNEEEAAKFSPLFHTLQVGKHTSFLIVVGEHESSSYHMQSSLMHNKLKSEGYKSKLIISKTMDHFNIVENLVDDDYDVLKIILKIIKS